MTTAAARGPSEPLLESGGSTSSGPAVPGGRRWQKAAVCAVAATLLCCAALRSSPANRPELLASVEQQELSELGRWAREQKLQLVAWSSGAARRELVTIVVGNEASDADSIVTALTYGFLKAAEREPCEAAGAVPRVFIPLIKCRREHMRLRQEVLLILHHAGVSPADLVHIDDEEFRPLQRLVDLEDPTFHVILVDHNQADGLLRGKVDGRVVEIIDHHKDQQDEEGTNVIKRVIAFNDTGGVPLASSACSVVGGAYLRTPLGQQLLAADGGAVAGSLLAVITIDSKDLSEASARDKEIVKELRARIRDPSRELPFKVLHNKRTSPAFWAGESLEANLLYDFKQFEAAGLTCGISSTFLSLDALEKKLADPQEAAALQDYVQQGAEPSETQSTVFMIMLKQAGMHLAVASELPALLPFSRSFLLGLGAADLQLVPLSRPSKERGAVVDFYSQRNHRASRKQVGPDCQAMLAAFCRANKC